MDPISRVERIHNCRVNSCEGSRGKPWQQPRAVHFGWLCGGASDVSDRQPILSLDVAYAPVFYPMDLIVA